MLIIQPSNHTQEEPLSLLYIWGRWGWQNWPTTVTGTELSCHPLLTLFLSLSWNLHWWLISLCHICIYGMHLFLIYVCCSTKSLHNLKKKNYRLRNFPGEGLSMKNQDNPRQTGLSCSLNPPLGLNCRFCCIYFSSCWRDITLTLSVTPVKSFFCQTLWDPHILCPDIIPGSSLSSPIFSLNFRLFKPKRKMVVTPALWQSPIEFKINKILTSDPLEILPEGFSWA